MAFLVNFPSVVRISEADVYDWVPLKGGNVIIDVNLWNDDSFDVGKLSTIGFTQEVDTLHNEESSRDSKELKLVMMEWCPATFVQGMLT